MRITKQAGQQKLFVNQLGDAIQFTRGLLSSVGWHSIKRLQADPHSGIVDTQELSRTGPYKLKMFALSPFFIHELKYGIGQIGVLEDCAGDHKQGFSQMGRATLGNTAGLGVERAGLEGRRVHARESHQSALVGKPPHIADLRYGLRACNFACALHGHDHIELRQQGSQTEHLAPQDIQRVIDGVQAVHCLNNQQSSAVVFRKTAFLAAIWNFSASDGEKR